MQFSSINEGGYIRTTPTASPRSSKSLGRNYAAARSDASFTINSSTSNVTSPHSDPLSSEDELEDISATPTPASPSAVVVRKSPEAEETRGRTVRTGRPPPILKKSGSGSSESADSVQGDDTKIGAAAEDDDETVPDDDDLTYGSPRIPSIKRTAPSRRPTATRFNEEVAVSIPKVSSSVPRSAGDKYRRSSGDSTSSHRSGRRNPIVIATTRASRRKLAVLPRRSSGTSSLGNSRTSSFSKLACSPKADTIDPSTVMDREGEAKSTRIARAASPHPSKQRRRLSPGPPSDEEDTEEEDIDDEEVDDQRRKAQKTPFEDALTDSEDISGESDDKENQTTKTLVDPNFRSKFVNNPRSQRSLTNLHNFARKSTASISTAASFQATGTMGSGPPVSSAGRVKGKEAFTNVTAPLKAPASAGPETDEENVRPLPKTKSQLTLLLEREKSRSG